MAASRVIMRGTSPEAFRLMNKAIEAQGQPTINRADRRRTAKVIEARERRKAKEAG